MVDLPEFEEFDAAAKFRAGVRGSYNGHDIEVATGYDIASDSWPIHVCVDGQKPVGVRLDRYSSYEDAVRAGVEAAKRVIDHQFGTPGFQRAVDQ